MGTRADFYMGRGESAEWLGSIASDGYPQDTYGNGVPAAVLAAVDEPAYRAAVAAFFAGKRSATMPEQGWPWPWKDSRTTDWAYAFDAGAVWACHFGRGWFPAAARQRPDFDGTEPKQVFPQFDTDHFARPGDDRSGVIAFRL